MNSKLPESPVSNEFLYLRKTDSVELFAEELTFDKSTAKTDEEVDTRIAAILKQAGMNTYGDVLDYAQEHFFSDLPGIDAYTAELIHRKIESTEDVNKTMAVAKLSRTQQALNKLAAMSQEVITDLTRDRTE